MLKTFCNNFLNAVAPRYCPSCYLFINNELDVFCAHCDKIIPTVASFNLQVTSKFNIIVHAASNYTNPVKNLILAKRRSDRTASYLLAQVIWKKTILPYLEFDYLVPIPLHWTRFAWRGYNQSEIMAMCLSTLSGKPILKVLVRTKITKYQAPLDPLERGKNMRGAFFLKNDVSTLLQNKRVVLVDDLLTTGATIISATKEILKADPETVAAVVASRVV